MLLKFMSKFFSLFQTLTCDTQFFLDETEMDDWRFEETKLDDLVMKKLYNCMYGLAVLNLSISNSVCYIFLLLNPVFSIKLQWLQVPHGHQMKKKGIPYIIPGSLLCRFFFSLDDPTCRGHLATRRRRKKRALTGRWLGRGK